MHWHVLAVDATGIPNIGAAVEFRIAVKEFRVETRTWHAKHVILSRHWCEIDCHNDALFAVFCPTNERVDAVLPVVCLDPLKTQAGEVLFVECRFVQVEPVEITDQIPNTEVTGELGQRPIKLLVVIPLGPLGDLATHEQHLFAWHRVLIAVQQTQIRELLPRIAWHLRNQ